MHPSRRSIQVRRLRVLNREKASRRPISPSDVAVMLDDVRACLASAEAQAMPVQDLSFPKDANAGPAFTDTVRFSRRRVPPPSTEQVQR